MIAGIRSRAPRSCDPTAAAMIRESASVSLSSEFPFGWLLPEPVVGGDGVGLAPGVEDRVVGELDPLSDTGRVEDVDLALALGVVDQRGQLEPAGGDRVAPVRPARGRIRSGRRSACEV